MLGVVLGAVLAALVVPAPADASPGTSEPKVTNGQDAAAGEYPYMVSLQAEGVGHFCGGSIVDREWVLTAAHCVDGSEIEVVVGTVNRSGAGGTRIDVDEQIVHPEYDPETTQSQVHDIALLHLMSPATVQPVSVARTAAFEAGDTPATLTGWGSTKPDDPTDPHDDDRDAPPVLQEATFPIIDDATCQAELAPDGYDSGRMLCAGAPDPSGSRGVDACFGDSGGPLVTGTGGARVQVGVVSFGPGCAYYPSGYTQVSAYAAFIDAVVYGVDDGELDRTVRVAGSSREATAAQLATTYFDIDVPVAFVVTGAAFPDALASASTAAVLGGPVLLVRRDELPRVTADALDALAPQRIVVVGGTSAISDAVLAALGDHTGGDVTRVAGTDRFETAVALSALAFADGPGERDSVVLASGASFADALAGAAAAAAAPSMPLLLTERDSLPAATRAELSRLAPAEVFVLGGTGAISDAVIGELAELGISVTRIAGPTRYDTAAATVDRLFDGSDEVLAATGASFPDGLVAGALGRPLVLVPPDGSVPDAAEDAIGGLAATSMVVLGGTGAVPQSQALALDELVGG